MDINEKLRILSDAAKYDVSCSSSGSKRASKKGALGSTSNAGICHSFTPSGRCISLLKILLTNYCIYDCSYCINRSSNDVESELLFPCNYYLEYIGKTNYNGNKIKTFIIKE